MLLALCAWAFITLSCKQIKTKYWCCCLVVIMTPLNKKDSTEKQIRQIAKQLKANGAIISKIAENIEDKKSKRAPRVAVNPSLN